MSCWVQTCGRASSPPSQVYCDVHWKHLDTHLGELTAWIGRGAASLYVGRTNYPERRLLTHFADKDHDRFAILHWTAHRYEIEAIEKSLIEVVKTKFSKKGKNKSSDSEGKRSGPWNAVYVSWREMAKSPPIPTLWREVRNLDEPPVCPTPGFLALPVFLRAACERGDAKRLINERYAQPG